MKTFLRSPAGPEGDTGSGPDNLNSGLMDAWGDGNSQPAQQPVQRQVTPPQRPQQQVVSDSQPAQQQQQEPQQQVQQTPAAAPSLSDADLTRIAAVAAGAVRQSQPQQAPAQESPMTDEQFAARYRTPKVDAAVMQAILDTDPVKGAAALSALLKQTYTSALLMSNDLHQAEIAKVRGEFEPHISTFRAYQQQQQKVALENEFYSLHQDLANERELVNETIDAFQAKASRGEVRFTDKSQAFKAVADSVRKILSRMGATPANGGQQTPNHEASSSSGPRKMAAATSQGRSATGQFVAGTSMEKMMDSWDR